MENLDDSEKNAKISDSAYANSCSNSQSLRSEMENLDDSEKNAKISDSAYANSCSNSQSLRSSSKSSHSGSNSSGSSGYGGKESTSGSSGNIVPKSKKYKQGSRKRAFEKPALLECRPPEPIPMTEAKKMKMQADKFHGKDIETSISVAGETSDGNCIPMDQDLKTDENQNNQSLMTVVESHNAFDLEGFSCAISMQDGVVMYTSRNLSANLGFRKEMWVGRSFIDFLHPQDRNCFASKIMSSLAIPMIINGTPTQKPEKIQPTDLQDCTMACRVRRYKALGVGFLVKDRTSTYVPYVLKFSFKEIKDEDGSMVYLIIKATPLCSAYKTPNEILLNPVPFVIRHSATGALEYIDIESVPYLGFLPQDVNNQDALQMYHPDDLPVLKIVYETIVKEGGLSRSMPYRMITQNGDYVKLETEWTSFVNPWTMKLEFVIGKHFILEGPTTTDVFKAPPPPPDETKMTEEDKKKIEATKSLKEDILKILKDFLTKPAVVAKEQIIKRVHDIAMTMESLLEENKPVEEPKKIEVQDGDTEHDSVMLGSISPHHEYKDSLSSSETMLSYNRLNFNENIQRYFDSHSSYRYEVSSPPSLVAGDSASVLNDQKMLAEADAKCYLSPAPNSNDFDNSPTPSVNSSTHTPSDFPSARLTESMLIQHNNDMEKELAKTHRKPHNLKRTSNNTENEIPSKKSCSRQSNKNIGNPQSVPTNTIDVGMPLPIYYPRMAAPVRPQVDRDYLNIVHFAQNLGYPQISHLNYQPTHMPWSSYPQPVYGSPHLYSTMPCNMHQHKLEMAQLYQSHASPVDLSLHKPDCQKDKTERTPGTNFMVPGSVMPKPEIIIQITGPDPEPEQPSERPEQRSEPLKQVVKQEAENPTGRSDEDTCRNDEGSSYSSFYSSFLKTDSGSNSNSDQKKHRLKPSKQIGETPDSKYQVPIKTKDDSQENMDKMIKSGQVNVTMDTQYNYQVPMKSKDDSLQDDMDNLKQSAQVAVPSGSQYQYQVPMKNKDDSLHANIDKITDSGQPLLVNSQLHQLYMELKSKGIDSLTLEEGITSSSSSAASSFIGPKSQHVRSKRNYSKLNMIYEENAPLPSPCGSDFPMGLSPAASVTPTGLSPAPSDLESSGCEGDVSTS